MGLHLQDGATGRGGCAAAGQSGTDAGLVSDNSCHVIALQLAAKCEEHAGAGRQLHAARINEENLQACKDAMPHCHASILRYTVRNVYSDRIRFGGVQQC